MNKYHDFRDYHMNNKVIFSISVYIYISIYIETWTSILHKPYSELMFSFMYSTKSSHEILTAM